MMHVSLVTSTEGYSDGYTACFSYFYAKGSKMLHNLSLGY